MMALSDRQPIIVADAGPLIRLAAAGLLDSVRQFNKRVVLVDRVEDEVTGDLTKPYAIEIKDWLDRMGPAVERVQTIYGLGIESLRSKVRSPSEDAMLKSSLRNSGELALREFIERWQPTDAGEVLVIYEDKKVGTLFMDAEFPLTLMTTRSFAHILQKWGINSDAVRALEAIGEEYSLKEALYGDVDPNVPSDMRILPQPMFIKVRQE